MTGSVGFVGLGAMGSRMARRLVDAGWSVTTWARSGATVEGAEAAATPADVASRSRIVMGCLLDGPAVEDVYLGGTGLMAGASAGSILVEHGTYEPALARRLAGAFASKGMTFLDAPVTGGPEGAERGTLVMMVGGDEDALTAAREPLSAYAHEIVHVGGSGAGLTLKVINQFLVAVHIAGAAEAAALLRNERIDPQIAVPVLTGGWAASAMLSRELPRALAGEFESTGATIGGLLPTVSLAGAALRGAAIESRVYGAVRGLLEDAIDSGLSDADPAALVELYGPQGASKLAKSS